MRRLTAATLTTTALLALAACGGGDDGSGNGGDGDGGLRVTSAYMPRPVTGSMAAGYFVIENTGDRADTLTAVTSDIADEVTVHKTSGQSMENAGKADRVIPAHGKLVLESGGTHLMFEKLKRTPEEGDTVSVELRFAEADPLTVDLPVKPPTYRPASDRTTSDHAASGGPSSATSSHH